MQLLKQHVVVPLALSVALALWLLPFMAGYGTTAFWGAFDIYGSFNCYSYFTDYCLHKYQSLPLWNPLSICGTPFAANPSTLLAYPPNLVRSFLNFDPTPYSSLLSIYISVLAHLLLAGVTTFYFARRRHGLSTAASLAAAFVFILSACMSRKITAQWVHVTVVAWVPLIFMQLHDIVQQAGLRRKLFHSLVCALGLGMALLGGFPQIAFCIPPLGLVYVVALVAAKPRAKQSLGEIGTILAACSVALLVAGLVSMALMFPAAEYTPFTPRSHNFEVNSGTEFHYSALELLKYLTSYPGGNIHSDIRAAGAIALFFAALSLWHTRRRGFLPVLALFLVGVDLSLGAPLPFSSLMIRFAPYQIVNVSRVMVLTCFPLGLLAGYGVDAITSRLVTQGGRAARTGFELLIACPILLGAYLGIEDPYYGSLDSQGHALLLLSAPAAAIGLSMLAGWLEVGKLTRGALVVALVAEVTVWNTFLIPNLLKVQVNACFDGTGCTATAPAFTNCRESMASLNTNLYKMEASIGGHDAVYILNSRQFVCSSEVEKTYKRLVDPVDSMKHNVRDTGILKRFFWLARQFTTGPLPDKRVSIPAATTVILSEPAPGVKQVPRTAVFGRAVSTNVQTTPVRFAQGAEPVSLTEQGLVSEEVSLPALNSALYLVVQGQGRAELLVNFEDFKDGKIYPVFRRVLECKNARPQTVEVPLLDSELGRVAAWATSTDGSRLFLKDAYIQSDLSDENGLIRINGFTPNTASVTVGPLDGPRVLSFLDSAYPGWTATVDGKPAPLLTAFDGFKAVALDKGSHEVTFKFRPTRVYVGWGVSLVTIGMALFGLYWLKPAKVENET